LMHIFKQRFKIGCTLATNRY